MFNRGHALPRFQHPFSVPPDFRLLSGGRAEPKPVADRPVAGRSTGGIAVDHPPAHPFHMLRRLRQPHGGIPWLQVRRAAHGPLLFQTGYPLGDQWIRSDGGVCRACPARRSARAATDSIQERSEERSA